MTRGKYSYDNSVGLLPVVFLVYKAFLGLAPCYLCKLIMRPLSAISDRPLRSLVRNDLLVPRSRTSTSQQCAFASAGPLLWNCLPVKMWGICAATPALSTALLVRKLLNPRLAVFSVEQTIGNQF